jgi:hypothetical protein
MRDLASKLFSRYLLLSPKPQTPDELRLRSYIDLAAALCIDRKDYREKETALLEVATKYQETFPDRSLAALYGLASHHWSRGRKDMEQTILERIVRQFAQYSDWLKFSDAQNGQIWPNRRADIVTSQSK